MDAIFQTLTTIQDSLSEESKRTMARCLEVGVPRIFAAIAELQSFEEIGFCLDADADNEPEVAHSAEFEAFFTRGRIVKERWDQLSGRTKNVIAAVFDIGFSKIMRMIVDGLERTEENIAGVFGLLKGAVVAMTLEMEIIERTPHAKTECEMLRAKRPKF